MRDVIYERSLRVTIWCNLSYPTQDRLETDPSNTLYPINLKLIKPQNTHLKYHLQVQPLLNGATKFSRAYDCTGFMSAPILSGLFIASILLFVLTIAITAILDIKTPTRFENRHSKPLTFNVQE